MGQQKKKKNVHKVDGRQHEMSSTFLVGVGGCHRTKKQKKTQTHCLYYTSNVCCMGERESESWREGFVFQLKYFMTITVLLRLVSWKIVSQILVKLEVLLNIPLPCRRHRCSIKKVKYTWHFLYVYARAGTGHSTMCEILTKVVPQISWVIRRIYES